MNILYLCDEYPPGRHGGIGVAVKMLAAEMAAAGNHVIVAGNYAWGYGGEDFFMDGEVAVYRFRRRWDKASFNGKKGFFSRVINKLLRITGILEADIKSSMHRYQQFIEGLIVQHSIDIIEMPDYNDYMRFCKGIIDFPPFSVPVIVKIHGSMTYIAKGNSITPPDNVYAMEKAVLHNANAVSSVSKYAAIATARYFDYHKSIEIIPNIVAEKDGIEMPKQRGKVVFTGTLQHNKGIFTLIKAWNIVIEQIPDAQLVLLGKGPVVKVSSGLSAKAQPSVSFRGHVPRSVIFEELADAEVAVFPSFAETFGLAPLEAMACGTATIFTKTTSGPELITHEYDGLLTDPADPADVAEAIIKLLQDDELRMRLAKQGKITVREKFNKSDIVAAHLTFYQKNLNYTNS